MLWSSGGVGYLLIGTFLSNWMKRVNAGEIARAVTWLTWPVMISMAVAAFPVWLVRSLFTGYMMAVKGYLTTKVFNDRVSLVAPNTDPMGFVIGNPITLKGAMGPFADGSRGKVINASRDYVHVQFPDGSTTWVSALHVRHAV